MDEFSIKMGKDFIWEVATAAYQIEGARNEDEKKDSIWDVFCRSKGNIKDGSSGDFACDSYHRVNEDLDLIEQLNVNAYRFSIAWSRLIPDGVGEINQKGVDYYNKIINGLIERNITPYITLYHWDLPQALSVKGGFLNPDFPKWFEYYVSIVVKFFGDRVNHFFTFNEPQCFIGLGYDTGTHAPGLKLSVKGQLQVLHHVLLAHGLGGRRHSRRKHVVGAHESTVEHIYISAPVNIILSTRKNRRHGGFLHGNMFLLKIRFKTFIPQMR